jgi:hypothetical protein
MFSTSQTKLLERTTTIWIAGSWLASMTMAAFVAGGALMGGSQPALAGGTAPACIVRGARGQSYIQIINKCSRKERVQVLVGLGPDTKCTTIEVGEQFWFEWPLGGYDKTVVCG